MTSITTSTVSGAHARAVRPRLRGPCAGCCLHSPPVCLCAKHACAGMRQDGRFRKAVTVVLSGGCNGRSFLFPFVYSLYFPNFL